MQERDTEPTQASDAFRVAYVEGVSPGKWLRLWADRYPEIAMEAVMVHAVSPADLTGRRSLDMALVRQPFDATGLHLIPLYEEVAVVVVPRDHAAAEYDELTLADLAGLGLVGDPSTYGWSDVGLEPLPGLPPLTPAQIVETVAAGTGIALLPMSIARLHHRKDVVARPVVDLRPVGVGLAWDKANEDPNLERFIGIVRGRTVRSSRSEAEPATPARGPKAPTGRPQRRTGSGSGAKSGRPRTRGNRNKRR